MATYKEVKGLTVQTRDTDPTVNAGTWASAPSLNTARQELAGTGSSGSNALAFGGDKGGGSPHSDTETEKFDGSSWTEVNDLNQARVNLGGAGTNTAALAIAGSSNPGNTNYVEQWNGTNWTEIAEVNTAKSTNTAAGTTTAAISVGGEPSTGNTQVELWNGSSWTETTEVNSAKNAGVTFGTSTATISAAGGGGSTNTEYWNGSSWTEVNELNQSKYSLSGFGTYTAGLVFGGQIPPYTANTEQWDGTSWTEVNNLGTATAYQGSSSNAPNTDGLNFGGAPTIATTEQWSFPAGPHLNEGDIFLSAGTTLKGFGKAAGIPSGSWGSAANINTARGDGMYGFGTTSAAGIAGGDDGTPGDSWVANTEIYNGSTWSEQADLNTGRYFAIGSGGTTTAAIGVAGRAGSSNIGNTETWNGSAWTETTDLNNARRGVLSNQPPSAQTQILVYSGYTTTQLANTESWDGSTWTELSDLNSGQYTGGDGGAGPSDAIAAGGQPASPGKQCEFWDGTSWTEGADLNTVRIEGAASGATSTSVIFGGGNNPGGTGLDTVEYYNGSSWTEIADLADGGNGASHHIGSAHDTFFVGGISPTTPNAASASTEHFTADNALGDITVS